MANEACTSGCPECGRCCQEVASVKLGRQGFTEIVFKCPSCENIWPAELVEEEPE